MLKRASRNLRLLLASSFISTLVIGCAADMPSVSLNGEIEGGHPKLHQMVATLKILQHRHALKEKGIEEAWYTVALLPKTPRVEPFFCFGTLPATDRYAKANYVILCSADTIDEVRLAMVTQVLMSNSDPSGCRCSPDSYWWEADHWVNEPPVRWSAGVARRIDELGTDPKEQWDREW
jgi:hypothetical protein